MTYGDFDAGDDQDGKSHADAAFKDQPRDPYSKPVSGGPWLRVGDIDAAFAASYQQQDRWLLAAFSGNGAAKDKAALFKTIDTPENILALKRAGLIASERTDWPNANKFGNPVQAASVTR